MTGTINGKQIGKPIESMGNLAYCTPDVRAKVEAVLANDSVRFTVKAIIRNGLNRDCLDATRDATLAAGMLELVSNSILG